ncbi:enterochelin esterase [Phytohabitans suffuscus]|uniref:Enterochelin esterase n=1 Tax=Phytohabitans suffuscus TaxID=624315 RepID=A0A6F8YFQ6_9ACTN|nr:enterochelin esterase [Phytohabitans suffuscus]BCB84808.1 enterochelin esterase [Phytohabitans suffuscus]
MAVLTIRPPAGSAVPPHTPRPYPLDVVSSPRVSALAAALAAGAGPGAVDAFWAEAARLGTPLVEAGAGGGHVVTFLWRDADAAAVVLHANRLSDFRDLGQSLMRRLAGTDVWHLSYRMPGTWRGSYRIGPLAEPLAAPGPDRAPDRAAWRGLRAAARTDPLNRSPLRERPGAPALSVVALPHAPAQPWLARRPGVPRGAVTVHKVRGRLVRAYLPPGAGHRELPVVVLLDGEVWSGDGGLASTMDNLAHGGRLPPAAVLMVDSGDVPARTRDLGCDPGFASFLAGDLLAWAGARWPVTRDPARTVVAGQSLGGLTAAYTAFCAAERFGAALCQSPSLWFPGGDAAEWLTGRYAAAPKLPVRWYLEVGGREWDLVGPVRRFRDALTGRGYRLSYAEYDGGHDIACWRGGLADGLVALLG